MNTEQRQIVFKVLRHYATTELEFGYFFKEEDAKDELITQTKRLVEFDQPGIKAEFHNNGYLGLIVDQESGAQLAKFAIHPIMLR